jgi:hypothetical protein
MVCEYVTLHELVITMSRNKFEKEKKKAKWEIGTGANWTLTRLEMAMAVQGMHARHAGRAGRANELPYISSM